MGAGALALLAYGPWIPVLFNQVDQVNTWYPGSELSWDRVERIFISWMIGVHPKSAEWPAFGLLSLAAGTGIMVVVRRDRSGWFFLLQAFIPWVLALYATMFFDRPVFVERGLAFAHFSLFGFWGVIWSRCNGWLWRFVLSCFLGTFCLSGLMNTLKDVPSTPPAEEVAMAWLKQNHRPGDVFFVAGPRALIRLRYYATQAGMTSIDVRCPEPSSPTIVGRGFYAAVEAVELLPKDQSPSTLPCPRLWVVDDKGVEGQPLPPDRKWLGSYSFEGGGATSYELTLYGENE